VHPAICALDSGSKRAQPRTGSRLVAQLHTPDNKAASVQIALRLPAPDLEQAREIAARKGIGYQTLLKMLVHE
jgi:predicted DNA binding CopG/RHH family protein